MPIISTHSLKFTISLFLRRSINPWSFSSSFSPPPLLTNSHCAFVTHNLLVLYRLGYSFRTPSRSPPLNLSSPRHRRLRGGPSSHSLTRCLSLTSALHAPAYYALAFFPFWYLSSLLPAASDYIPPRRSVQNTPTGWQHVLTAAPVTASSKLYLRLVAGRGIYL
jgi:hypothetical protein